MITNSLALALVVAGSSMLSAQQLVFIDDGMDPADYLSFSFTNPDNDADASFEFGDPIPSGGNPGGYLEVSHFHDVQREDDGGGPDQPGSPVGGDGATQLQSIFIEQASPYSSPEGSAIQSITFLLDVRTFDSGELGFAIENPGGGSLIFEHTLIDDGQWNTYETTVFQDPDGTILDADFSATGPFSFGFSLSSDADATFGEEVFVYDVDNFVVTLNGIPEPSSSLLLGGALLLLLNRRRRWKT